MEIIIFLAALYLAYLNIVAFADLLRGNGGFVWLVIITCINIFGTIPYLDNVFDV
jgi:hypothetical protein